MAQVRQIWLILVAAALTLGLLASGDAWASIRGNKLNDLQYAYSAAIRWGDFEGAWNLVDPEYRNAHPMSDLEFERYKQVQISAYTDKGTQELPDGTVVREIEVGVINVHTMEQRSVRYVERWRYDKPSKTWWITDGLPDLWQGE